jgi:hypothetical protein
MASAAATEAIVIHAALDDDPPHSPLPSPLPTVNDSLVFSSAWDWFKKGVKYNTCTYKQCGSQISVQTDHGTSNMLIHLRNVHDLKHVKGEMKKASKKRKEVPISAFFTSSTSPLSTIVAPSSAKKKEWTLMLLRLAVQLNTSFRALTESTVLRRFMEKELGWQLPGRMTLHRLLPVYYKLLMDNLRMKLVGVESISITTDSTFLTLHQVPYICVTGHWIDNNWLLHNCLLSVFLADQKESGDYIAYRLRDVLENQLGLVNKVHCVVTDEGKNFLNAVSSLRHAEVLRESLRCACHRIQLTIKGALLHKDCNGLLVLLNRCQLITLQFKNGWMSRKRDVLRKYQDLYLKELSHEVDQLRQDIAARNTRTTAENLAKKQKDLEDAVRERDLDDRARHISIAERSAVGEELGQFGIVSGNAASCGDDASESDSDEEEEGKDTDESGDDNKEVDIGELAIQQKELKDLINDIFKKKALIAKAATRWMTYVAVVERTLMWRKPLMQALDEIAADSSFKKRRKGRGGNEDEVNAAGLRISEDEAVVLGQFIGIGSQARDSLVSLEGERSCTVGSLLWHHSRLLKFLGRAAKAKDTLDPLITRFCEIAAANCAVKFTASIDKPALIGAALDPRHRQLSFLSQTEAAKCRDATFAAFTALELELKDDAPLEVEPQPKRKRKGEQAFSFSMDEAPTEAPATEVARYFALPNEPPSCDVLSWWKLHSSMFPVLARLARRYLAIPASSAASERLFSQLKLTATPARQNMKPDTLCMLLFVDRHDSDSDLAAMQQQ